jgi:sec-independent protein translocase protein TatB
MNILGIGPMELLLIVVLALIVLGPEKLPEVMAQVGRAMNQLRKVTTQLSDEFNRTIQAEFNETRSVVEEARAAVSGARANVDEALMATTAPRRLDEAALASPLPPTTDATAPSAQPGGPPLAQEAVTRTDGADRSTPNEASPWGWDIAVSPLSADPAASAPQDPAAPTTSQSATTAQPVRAMTRSKTNGAATDDLVPPGR